MVKPRFHREREIIDYTGCMTEMDKEVRRIQHNTEVYEKYGDANGWIKENHAYIRFAVNKLLKYSKYKSLMQYKRDFHQEGVLVVMDRFPKYKPGLRGINSWLYTQLHFYVAKMMRRKYLRKTNPLVGGGMVVYADIDYSADPAMLLEWGEEETGVSVWDK